MPAMQECNDDSRPPNRRFGARYPQQHRRLDRAVTVHASPAVRTSSSFPNNIGASEVGTVHWTSGTNFILSAYANSGSPTYLLLSSDNGATWTDITSTGAINSTCAGVNLSVGSVVRSHTVFARCQDCRAIW